MIAETGQLKTEDSSVREKLAYGEFMDMTRDEIVVDSEVWTEAGKAPQIELL